MLKFHDTDIVNPIFIQFLYFRCSIYEGLLFFNSIFALVYELGMVQPQRIIRYFRILSN